MQSYYGSSLWLGGVQNRHVEGRTELDGEDVGKLLGLTYAVPQRTHVAVGLQGKWKRKRKRESMSFLQ